jgi:APA family basic amino acid/polyamine antiporter
MSARPTALARRLGAFDAAMIVMGGMVGAGIFVNPAVVARAVPSETLSLLAWAAGGGVALLGAFLYAELAERLPEAGGQYAYLREAWHPLVGFLYGWTLLLVTGSGGQAAVAMTFARYLRVLTGLSAPEGAVAVATLAAVAAVNLLGVRAGGTLQSSLMVTKAAAIALLVFAGLFLAPAAVAPPPPLPASGSLLAAFGAALVPVFFAYGGYQNTGFAAEELQDPERDLARGLLRGVAGVILLYVSVAWVSVRVLGPDGLAATGTPASDVMTRALGGAGGRLIALGIAVSTLGFLSHGILTLPRAYFAMARDGVFFRKVASLTPRTRVPAFAILAQAAVASALALSGRYEQILGFVMSVDVLFFAATGAALFVYRRRGGPSPRVTMPGHPATTLVYVAACFAVAVSAWLRYPRNAAAGLGILLSGVPAYLLWTRTK